MSFNENFLRQLSLVNQEAIQTTSVTIIGAGNLGSILVPILCKMGVREIYVYDSDIIAPHNISNQAYGHTFVGKRKVNALGKVVLTVAPKIYSYMGFAMNVCSDTVMKGNTDIVFCLTDSIRSRCESFVSVLLSKEAGGYQTKYFIEAGTHRTTAKIYVVDLDNMKEVNAYYAVLLERYENETTINEDLACTERSTYFYATYLGSIIAQKFSKLLDREPIKTFETWVDMGLLFQQEFDLSDNETELSFGRRGVIEDWWELVGYSVGDLWDEMNSDYRVQLSSLTLEKTKRLFLKVYNSNTIMSSSVGNHVRHLPVTPFLDRSGIAIRSNGKAAGFTDTNCDYCICSYCQIRGDCRTRACHSQDTERRCAEGNKKGRFVWCKKIPSLQIDGNTSLSFEMFKPLEKMDIITNQDVLFCEALFFSNWIGETNE